MLECAFAGKERNRVAIAQEDGIVHRIARERQRQTEGSPSIVATEFERTAWDARGGADRLADAFTQAGFVGCQEVNLCRDGVGMFARSGHGFVELSQLLGGCQGSFNRSVPNPIFIAKIVMQFLYISVISLKLVFSFRNL